MTYLLIPQNNLPETMNAVLAVSNSLTFMGNFVMIKYLQTQNFSNIKFDQIIEISARTTSTQVPNIQNQNIQVPQQNIIQNNPANLAQHQTINQTNQVVASPKPQQFSPTSQPVTGQGISASKNPQDTVAPNIYPQPNLPNNVLPAAQSKIDPIDPKFIANNSQQFSPSPKPNQSQA